MFIVIGTTGEYSDRTEWYVAAYWEESKAKEHALKAKQRTARIVSVFGDEYNAKKARREGDPGAENPFDPCWECDYTGTDYCVVEVPLLEAVPLDSCK
jgi:hypothetical protein